MKTIFITVLLLSGSALAENHFCSQVKDSSLLMSVHGANWSNAKTTRTPEGGPYKYHDVKCSNGECQVVEKAKYKMVYEPGHPDANVSGYVKYPDIDLKKEFLIMSAHAQVIRQIAPNCIETEVINNSDSTFVKYAPGDSVKIDVFNFAPDKNLRSWSREYSNGHSQIINF